MLLTFLLFGLSNFSVKGLLGQNKQKVLIVIDGFSSSDKKEHFYKGEEFRKHFLFRQALKEYQYVVTGKDICGLESEAHYNIGLCYIWLRDLKNARKKFVDVIKICDESDIAFHFAAYGLAWIETKEKRFYEAIRRLQKELIMKKFKDMELSAKMQFHIGRIYLKYLHDYEKAEQAFKMVLEKYPNTKITDHPFLDHLKNRDNTFINAESSINKMSVDRSTLSTPPQVEIVAINLLLSKTLLF